MAIKINGVTVIDDSRVGTLVSATTTGNVVAGNVTTGGLISATGNATAGNLASNYSVKAPGETNTGHDAAIFGLQSGTLTGNAIVEIGANTAERTGLSVQNINSAGRAQIMMYNDQASNVTTGSMGIGMAGSTWVNTAGGPQAAGDGYIYAVKNLSNIAELGGNLVMGSWNAYTKIISKGNTVANLSPGGVDVTGAVSATGNITGNYIFGNGSQLQGIDATSIQSGTSNVRVVSSGGNVAAGIGGTSNVLVLASTGAYVTGLMSATGNITGANLNTGGLVSATGSVIGGGITLTGNTISSSGSTLTIDPATSGIEGSVIIAGNLSVQGNVTYIDSSTITTNEKDITLANNVNTQASVNGAGLLLGNNSVVTWTYNNASNTWVSNVGVSAVGNVTGGNLSGTNIVGTLTTAAQTNITSVGTLTSLNSGTISSSGNVTGANILTGGIVSATGNITGGNISATNHTGTTVSVTGTVTSASVVGGVMTGTSVSVTGTVTGASVVGGVMTGSSVSVTGTVTGASVVGGVMTGTSVSVSGAVTGGAITGSSLNITTGTANVGSITNANANGVGNIGNSTVYFNTVFAKATSAQYADLAEMYEADRIIESGTVVCFGGTREIKICDEDACRRVAGVVSTNPSYIMNAGLSGDHVVAVALTGRVPTRVTGTIRKGDMLVSTDDGRARADADPAVGAVIGKALADFDGADGTIEVVVGRL